MSHAYFRRSVFLVAVITIFLTISTRAMGAGEATKQVKIGIEAVLDILRDPDLKDEERKSQRRVMLREAIQKQFDFTEMSKRSLARQWKKRSDEEKIEFIDLFSGLMERNYIGKIEVYTDEKIKYTKEEIDEEFATVKTIIVTRDKQEIPITYSLHNVKDKWRVYDVKVKGVSLINTYRQQFRSVIRKSSYGGLVKILRRKKAEG
ncbi:MAG: ABC transporter substrate-binding protein [Nitrospinaceae bacterium]|jgi:phospholipid transport system substrate-binding protein|nr:ABC transporter substrate-binding protein [Nitrospinaceae bacterium]MBT3435332.1 ABC transporter substrate-binding protein [Nitrospinaceae bacterium]MBT4094773.1 ABC transporter substrate-binding protein [Nitrospinaceae bacterium]MBT4429593.1 ABC transporter substrate-binding protein [Nitrospinaceae bacterium]MBT5366507.1 ABC transporter substrate-binding protein [Nitrospinaceae bacterium]